MNEADVYFSTEKAAEMLGINPKLLQHWRSTGDGPRYIRLSRSKVRYLKADVVSWIETRKFFSTSEERAGKGVSYYSAVEDRGGKDESKP